MIGLILFRGFPLWLAALIVGRDLLILWGGVYLTRRHPGLVLPSNLTGKWAFASLVVLLGAYIIRFDFSIRLMTPITVILLTASLLVYGRAFVIIFHEHEVKPFRDRTAFRVARIFLTIVAAVAHVVMFWFEFLK